MTYEEFSKRYTFNTETDQLGEGGFGEVFKAYDTYIDEWVAIKQSKVKKGMENFTLQKEVELAKKLPANPNIAHYEDCFRYNIPMAGIFDFGILKYYKEGNLSSLRKNNKINSDNLIQIIKGILRGLEHLHQNKIIHRDIKPANILIVKRGDIYISKITDFGISKQGSNWQASAVSNSLAGGTYSYAAPEQLKGESQLRPNADLWSFGVMLYELLTNQLPFETTSHDKNSEAARGAVVNQILSGQLPNEINHIEEPFKQIIQSCLKINPKERIKSASAILELFGETAAPSINITSKNIPNHTDFDGEVDENTYDNPTNAEKQDDTFIYEPERKEIPKQEKPPVANVPSSAPTEHLSLFFYYVKCWKAYASFKDRARRKEFWGFFLFHFLIIILFNLLGEFMYILGLLAGDISLSILSLYFLASFIPYIAVAVRRIHDTGNSGWLILVPIYNIVLLFTNSTPLINKYGSPKK